MGEATSTWDLVGDLPRRWKDDAIDFSNDQSVAASSRARPAKRRAMAATITYRRMVIGRKGESFKLSNENDPS